ncbi:MAG: TRAP transporter substrate-binding protein [Oscillospiraceae bacterium]|jgi:tripartite ATP-independent transporter DctP family solute receptor|nr:TRAP transporter substrate-binding protein [Oscillospiraceae bacterium]
MKKMFSMMLALALSLSFTACDAGLGAKQPSNDGAGNDAPAGSTGNSGSGETTPAPVSGEDVPGFGVSYRSGDPAADLNASVTSTEKITWIVANCTTETNPQATALAAMAEELSTLTNGNFTLDIFYNSELGSEMEAVELCRNNTVQMVTSNVTNMATYQENCGVFALPYLFHSSDDMLEYLATSPIAYDMWEQLEENTGLVTLGFQCGGSRCLSTKGVKTASSPDGLKGIKVRSMDAVVWQDVISALGATPVPVAYTELYTALQTSVVQGQDNPAGNTVDGKFYEVLDTFYETEHCYLISAFYSNSDAWDSLPDDYKSVLLGLFQKYQGNQFQADMTAFTENCYTVMKDAGMTIVSQDELDMDAFYASASEMIDSKYKSNAVYSEIISDVTATFGY